jgi:hypothetical protein
MGLDMTLYLCKTNVKYSNDALNKYPKELKKLTEVNHNISGFISNEIYYEIAYWRKANAIHKWFIDNCGNGVDECQLISVSLNQIKSLAEVCNLVLQDNSIASEVLPAQRGFFFGSLEYDEYYFKCVQYTYNMCNTLIEVLNNLNNNNNDSDTDWSIVYQSSW